MAGRKTEIKRFMRAVDRPSRRLVMLLQDVEDPVNVGSAFRIADACRAEEIILTGISARPPHKLITKVGRGKERRVKWVYFENIADAIQQIKEQDFSIYAVEIATDALAYYDVPFPDRTCLLVGHEDHGVTRAALAACDGKVFIPMYGKGASLNVHVALGIMAFHVLHYDRGIVSK